MLRVRCTLLFLLLATPGAHAADAPDLIAQARLLYNGGQFDAAVSAAERARRSPSQADSADLIAARAYLERFRASAAPDDLANARARLARLDPQRFGMSERVELIVGLGETLFLEESYGAAAHVFESVFETSERQSADARERVLDWWASAVDRDAWPRPEIDRQMAYQRIRGQMREELAVDPSSSAAAYWLAAAARAQGDLQAAWNAAEAGWVRAPLTRGRGTALRADLDRLMLRAIVPERARVLAQPPESLERDWENFKVRWTKD